MLNYTILKKKAFVVIFLTEVETHFFYHKIKSMTFSHAFINLFPNLLRLRKVYERLHPFIAEQQTFLLFVY